MGKKLTIGIFVVLLVVGTTWIISESIEIDGVTYYPYKCEVLDVIGYCYEIKDSDTYGENSLCKYNHTSTRKYKSCRSGWEPFIGSEITGEEINISDEEIKDFLNFTEYEITDLRCDNSSCDSICFVIYGVRKYCNDDDNIIPYKVVCVSEGIEGEENITCSDILKTDEELIEDIIKFENNYLARVNLRIELNKPKFISEKPIRIAGSLKNIRGG